MVVIESLKFENVTLKFGGITALNEISFEVKPKKLYSIIGPNGAGKTSIFNCISGIYRPTTGTVKYGDNNINELRPDEVASLGIARTFQNIELFENILVLKESIFKFFLLIKSISFLDEIDELQISKSSILIESERVDLKNPPFSIVI